MNFPVKSVFQIFQRDFHIIMRLKIEPELRFHVEKTPKAKCRVGGYSTPAMDYFVYATWGHSNVFGQPILTDPHRFQEFRHQDLARVDRGKISFVIMSPLNGNQI